MSNPTNDSQVAAAETSGPNTGTAPRKRMTLFRAMRDDDSSHMEMEILGVDEVAQAGFARLMATGVPPGTGERMRVLFSESSADGMSLTYAWFKSGNMVPKHSHDVDCLYYILAGELRMGTQTLRKGEGIFVPKDFGYTFTAGPKGVELLEFRTTTKFHFKLKGNDDTFFETMARAQEKGRDVWPTERPPSETVR